MGLSYERIDCETIQPRAFRLRRSMRLIGGIATWSGWVAGLLLRDDWQAYVRPATAWILLGVGGLFALLGVWNVAAGGWKTTLEQWNPSQAPTRLSGREQLRVVGLLFGLALGISAAILGAFIDTPEVIVWDRPVDTPMVVLAGIVTWMACGIVLVRGWEDWQIEEDKRLREEESRQTREMRRQRRTAIWRWLSDMLHPRPARQTSQADTVARRFAREWLWLLGSILAAGTWLVLTPAPHEVKLDRFFLGGLFFGVPVYVATVIVRLTIWSIRRAF